VNALGVVPQPPCSAGWQPAVSPTGSRQAAGNSQRLRMANPRPSRLPVCATTAARRFRSARRARSPGDSLLEGGPAWADVSSISFA